MELYFLKSAACLAVLLLFYKLLLEKEDMHVFNRFYLLFSVVLSFLAPFITFTTYIEVPAETGVITSSQSSLLPSPPAYEPSVPVWHYVLWAIYGAGVLFFGIKFALNLRELMLKIRNNIQLKDQSYVRVLLKEEVVPHTFLKFIFLNKKKYEEHRIPREVFEHEQAHADQKHSYDILFMELLQVILWFHPLLYLTQNAIKLNHEFLADKSVLKKGTPAGEYQQMLLAFSSNASHGSLAHPINYSFIKKRFTVMRTQTSKRGIWARSLLVLPVAALLLLGFSTKEVVEKEMEAQQLNAAVPPQETATPEMIAEYNRLARYYNSRPDSLEEKEKGDALKLNRIYRLMTPAQREEAEPFPSHMEIIEVVEEAVKADSLPGSHPSPPPAPLTPKVVMGYPKAVVAVPSAPETVVAVPSPPPLPPTPVEHMKELAAKGARFFVSGKGEVSAEEAIKMVEENKNIRIQVKENDSNISVEITRTEK